MKKWIFFLVVFAGLFSCKNDEKLTTATEDLPATTLKVERFDKMFYESDPQKLMMLKEKYPFFFPEGNADTVWTNKLKNPLLQELYAEVKKKYPDNSAFQPALEQLVSRVKHFFPEKPTPRVITVITEVDTDVKAIYADSLILLSLDTYLGKDHRFYEGFPKYQHQGFEPSQMMPDLVASLAQQKVAPPSDRTLLAQMVYFGKILYLKDMLLPDATDAEKMEYTPEQIKWCEENEEEIWKYFVNEKILFDTDARLFQRFITVAPFSKFYLEIDNESPGRIGQWLGWQIVRSYMEQNPNSWKEMLVMDAKQLFDKSKYKPKK